VSYRPTLPTARLPQGAGGTAVQKLEDRPDHSDRRREHTETPRINLIFQHFKRA
jgi:hypothetical protein